MDRKKSLKSNNYKNYVRRFHTNSKAKLAVECVLNGETWTEVTKKTGIPYISLNRYHTMYQKDKEIFNKIDTFLREKSLIADRKVTEVFTQDEENVLKEYLKEFEKLFYGLSEKECRMLAYQMAFRKRIKLPDDWKHIHKMTSAEWLQLFKFRHPELITEIPDRCNISLVQNIVWEKKTVTRIYDTLEKLVSSNPALQSSERIYNLDEMYVSTDLSNKRTYKDMKGDIITMCCILSASGTSLPLVKILPVLPPNTIFDFNPKDPEAITITAHGGRMTAQTFPAVLKHFIKYSHSTLHTPTILIMDIDLSHLSLDAIDLAKTSGVNFITVHPHVSKQIQPLDSELCDLFHKQYQQCILSEKEKNIDDCDLCKIIDEAYENTMTPTNIKNAFKKCGIEPFDRDLFTDDDYLSIVALDLPCPDCRARDARCKMLLIENLVGNTNGNASSAVKDVQEKPDQPSTSSADRENLKTNKKKQIQRSKMATQQKGTELDKLKRRMIRTVARLLKEKKTEEEVWEELKKESGNNCKNLWDRMRSLTMKKLKRLLDADDRVELVPAVARMTLTDWMLYDLVIVHEKIDVIDRNDTVKNKVLNNLFSLVQLFNIEDRQGEDLADAWTAATVYYNSKGHQCSPMLMQRRWYQIKELTREKMYKFWFSYRGNQRLLATAKQDAPSELHRAIAIKYPDIVTQHFPDWEERIEKRLVIMPEEFEVKMRKKILMKPSDDNAPDVVIVEQKIDTIELDGDTEPEYSDEENSRESYGPENTATNIDSDETSPTPVIIQVKTEPQDDIDTVNHLPYQEPRDRFQDEIDRLKIEEDKILTQDDEDELMEDATPKDQNESQYSVMPLITSIQGGIELINEKGLEIDETKVPELSVVIEDDHEEFILLTKNLTEEKKYNAQDTNKIIDLASPEIKRSTQVYKNEIYENEEKIDTSIPIADKMVIDEPEVQEGNPMICEVATRFQVETNEKIATVVPLIDEEDNKEDVMPSVNLDFETEDMLVEDADYKKETLQDEESHDIEIGDEIISDMNFAGDGMEFADDGIEYVEENEDHNKSSETPEVQQNDEREAIPKFDLKLLMSPVVYTTKLDQMSVYKDRPLFKTIGGKELVDQIIFESKPISTQPIYVDSGKFGISRIKVENRNRNELDDDSFQNDSLDGDEPNIIDESKKLKLSSNLLQKPRSRSYNPIQLCKNPDFNTRLKRLNIGFFSSTRNRVMLKACKPMTIDVSKAFETKLIKGTMYLKPSDQVVETKNDDKVNESTVSILPSAVAVQSLMDTTDVDRILKEELKKRMLERNKTINLPNISVVRQINQQLLMAEVAPIMAQVNKSPLDDDVKNITVQDVTEISVNDGAKRLKLEPSDIAISVDCKSLIDSQSVNASQPRVNRAANASTYTNSNQGKNNKVGRPRTKSPVPVDESIKAKNDRILEIQKKIKERQRKCVPNWLAKYNPVQNDTMNNSLLTIDTLYKMLNVLNPCQEFASKLNKQKKYKAASKQEQKNMALEKLSQIAVKPDKQQKIATAKPKAINVRMSNKSNSTANGKKKRNCCWAKSKMEKITANSCSRLGKHKCPNGDCSCCCKELLKKAEIDMETKLSKCMEKPDTLSETIHHMQLSDAPDINNEVHQPAVHLVNVDSNAANVQPLNPARIHDKKASQINMDDNETVHIINNSTEVSSSKELVDNEDITIDLDDDDVSVPPSSVIKSPPAMRVYSGPDGRYTKQAKNSLIKSVLTNDITAIPESSPNCVQSSVTPIPKNSMLTKIRPKPSKYKLYSQEPEIDPTPCSCRPNVVVDQSSATLLVDGTNNCLRHTKSRISKETRIYLNRRHMSLTECPFYIAKDMILLTNVKEPRPPTPPPPDPAQITIPDGVQIALLPDGTVTYLVEPDVKLTPEQIAVMPLVLNGVQQQVKASGVTLPAPMEQSEVILKLAYNVENLDNGNVDGTCETSSVPSDSIQKSESDLQHKVSRESENSNTNDEESSITPSDSSQTLDRDLNATSYFVGESDFENEDNQKLCSNEANAGSEVVENTIVAREILSNANEVAVTKENTDMVTNENPSTELATNVGIDAVNDNVAKAGDMESENAASSNRNLLSDLMEMSGIMEEDIAPVSQESSTASLIPPESTLQPFAVPFGPEPSSSFIPVPGLSPLSNRNHSISAQINEKIHELHAITSFAELKYACDRKGLFFKLDLGNGVIVPINVCIQKNAPETSNQLTGTKFTEVIDLTDEKEKNDSTPEQSNATPKVSPNKNNDAKSLPNFKPRKLSSMLPVRALKAGKSVLKPITPDKKNPLQGKVEVPPAVAILEEKKQELLSKLSNNLKPFQFKLKLRQKKINIVKKSVITRPKPPLRKRFKNLNKIEAKIDLVDSDEPMEEEYLIENSSDDSDDEPLANLKNKTKSIGPFGEGRNCIQPEQDLQSAQEAVSQDGSISQDEAVSQGDEIDFEEAIDSIEIPVPISQNRSKRIGNEPAPTQLVLSGEEMNEPLSEEFLASEEAVDEDSQDGCILGV